MDFILFQCPTCKQPLKIPADKAGRKAKCNKCGNSLTIPAQSETQAVQETKPAPAAKRRPFDDEEEDTGPALYGLAPMAEGPPPTILSEAAEKKDEDEDEDEDDDEDRKPKKKEEGIPRRRRQLKGLRKAPQYPEKWARVRVGLVLVAASLFAGIAGLLVMRGLVLAGQFGKPSYAQVATEVFPGNILTAGTGPNQPPDVDLARFFVGLLLGAGQVATARTLYLVATGLFLMQGILAIVGYILYIQVPPRFGTRGLAIALLILTFVNLILLIVFRLLPAAGAISYVLNPVYTPELPMTSGNTARLEPFHVVWMHIPMLETFFALVIVVAAGLELVLGAAFLRAVGKSLRDDTADNRGVALMKLGMGTLFIYLFYLMAALAGTSDVLVGTLRILYWLYTCFLLGTLAWYATVLFQSRGMIAKKMKGI